MYIFLFEQGYITTMPSRKRSNESQDMVKFLKCDKIGIAKKEQLNYEKYSYR